MYRYKKLLVVINANNEDKAILSYASKVCQMAKSEEVHFVHVVKHDDIPQTLWEEDPSVLETILDHFKAEMDRLVDGHFACSPATKVIPEIVAGQPLIEILKKSRQMDADLIMIGDKNKYETARHLPEKLARKAPCSVLMIPENHETKISNILVPSDFSEYSKDALDVAVAFAKATELSAIKCVHAYSVPDGYFSIGKSYEEFAEIMKHNCETDYKKFIESVDLKGLKIEPEFKLEKHAVKAVEGSIKDNETDLLVFGARGRSDITAVLLGSSAEHLIHETNIPLIIVKKKNENLSFLDALLGL